MSLSHNQSLVPKGSDLVTNFGSATPETSKSTLLTVKDDEPVKVKVKLFLCLTNSALRHEEVRRSECINPRFLDLGTRWR
jgi:hypothetical protein